MSTNISNRKYPKFFFDKNNKQNTIASIDETAKKETIALADRICDDANNPDLVKRYEWSTKQYLVDLAKAFNYTKNTKYKEMCLQLFDNDVESIERSALALSMRLNHFIWSYFLLDSLSREQAVRILKAIFIFADYLYHNLQYDVPNNHLFVEAKNLYFAGILFPEFKNSGKWRSRGKRIFFREIRNQIRADGGHGEQSPGYHQLISGNILEMVRLLQINDIKETELIAIYEKMAKFEAGILKPDNTYSAFSDSGVFSSLERFSLNYYNGQFDEDTKWLFGGDYEKSEAINYSMAFKKTGYFVMRSKDNYLIFDCGPFGYEKYPGHGHADALNFELFINGETILTDSGTYTYRTGEWRDYFRGTAAHNTIVVDKRNQSEVYGEFDVKSMARCVLLNWVSNDDFDFADGYHDGYKKRGILHRRRILYRKEKYWLIIDNLMGCGQHTYDFLLHFSPTVKVEVAEPNQIIAQTNKTNLIIRHLIDNYGNTKYSEVRLSITKGWVSRKIGEKEEAPVGHLSLDGPPRKKIITLILPFGETLPKIDINNVRTNDDFEVSIQIGNAMDTIEHTDKLIKKDPRLSTNI